MNNTRRKQIREAVEIIKKGLSELETVKDDEQYAFDNLPEGLQQTMRGESMENNIEVLDEFIEQVEEAIRLLDDIE